MKLKLSEVVAKYGNVAIDEAKFKEVFGIKTMKGQKPKTGEIYWVIHSTGAVQKEWDDTHYDRARWDMGNAYDTQEEAEFARDKQIFLTKFERYLRENEDEHLDWGDGDQDKWALYMAYDDVSISCFSYTHYQGAICTTNKKALIKFLEDNESDIKKYMFGVL